ncbi:MAG: hypothetical protein ACRDGD_11820 [Candidatus Limnocylindria bacterium]
MRARTRWLLLVAIAGGAIFALSFLDAWIVHDREVRGEGYRDVEILLSAWRAVAVPVLTVGVLAALVTAVGAAALLVRPGVVPGWTLAAGSLVALAIIAASVVPIGADRQSTSIDLRPDWLTAAGIALAAAMLVGATAAGGFGQRSLLLIGLLGVVAFGAAAGGRWLTLELSMGSNQQWAEGSYTRPATDGQPSVTLTIDDGGYEIGDRWSGTWEGIGLIVSLDDDPACPDSRGTFHAHAAGEDGEDLRFVKIVDTCENGARAAALETGIWERDE